MLKYFSYFTLDKKFDISFTGDNLHEMSKPFFLGKKSIITVPYAELAQRMVKFKP